jgi:hypothetical protein
MLIHCSQSVFFLFLIIGLHTNLIGLLSSGADWGQKASTAIVLKRPQRHCGKNETIAALSLTFLEKSPFFKKASDLLKKASHHFKKNLNSIKNIFIKPLRPTC